MSAFSVEQVRQMEEQAMAALPDDSVLMQRAAAGLAAVLVRELTTRRGVYGAQVLILVGSGNNGGDALYAGQRLARRGARVTAVRCLGSPHQEGLAALIAAGGVSCDLSDLDEGDLWDADLAVDGVFGIGGRPGLPPPVADLARALGRADVPVIAVDLPSGVDCDTGAAPQDTIRAAVTVTFGVRKVWQFVEPARSRGGRVETIEIGLDVGPTEPVLSSADPRSVADLWPIPPVDSDKYSRGVVGIDTGSEHYPGAALLSVLGTVHAGAGMVRFLGPETAVSTIGAALPNVVFAPGRVQAHLLGSGWGDRSDGDRVVAEAVDTGLPVLIDADGLRHLPAELPAHCLLTPHAGELARLLDWERATVEADPLRAVRAGADRTGATVLLKGATQVVAQPRRPDVAVAVPGPAWTAQAGSGDVLGGVCAALLAAGLTADRAAVLGASLQAMTAARHPGPLPPQELARRFPATIGTFGSGGTSAE